MNIEDLKVGETYNVRVKVRFIEKARICCIPVFEDGTISNYSPNYFASEEARAMQPINPAPKYDPCRKLKKGDTVKYSPKDGRSAYRLQHNIDYEVKSDECPCGTVEIWIYKHERYERYPYSIFELVTPVEEQEPYCVKQGCEQEDMVDTFPYWSVVSSGCEVARFYSEQYEAGKAKAAAEAECARLNAEHRKENA